MNKRIYVSHSASAKTIDLDAMDIDMWNVDKGDKRFYTWLQTYDRSVKEVTARIGADDYLQVEIEDVNGRFKTMIALSPKVVSAIKKAVRGY
jgi:hypothetical protein